MKRYFCDRCGEQIDLNLDLLGTNSAANKISTEFTAPDPKIAVNITSRNDLCRDCLIGVIRGEPFVAAGSPSES